MKKHLFYFFLFSFCSRLLSAQTTLFDTPNLYRTDKNVQYWKNNKPFSDYWQQDVHYKIDAYINDTLDKIEGRYYELTYWNNSPFPLKELYFHVFQNAFVKDSYYDKLIQANHLPVQLGKQYEANGLGTVIQNIRINGQPVKSTLDNTILKINLNHELKSGDSLVVTLQFETYFDTGSMRRRMKVYTTDSTKHYDGVFWYPTICVYDKKLTWDTDQHLDKEFYHNYGTFDVALTFPHEYIVEATGNLINRNTTLPDTLRKKLDLKNFAKKPWNEKASIIIPREYGKTKTWIYHAENVHNFAFTADPLYRIGETQWNGIQVITLAQEPHASKWQLSGWYTAQVIRIYSTDFGMYDWPKIIIADAKDGMEYPMLTLDNGTYPQHQYLLSHEVGHMWFYGMVGSNETYRAFLDEGFTQFLTVWSMDKIVGPNRKRIHTSKFVERHLDSTDNRFDYLYHPYLTHVTEGRDEPLNTHSCAFNGAIRHGGNYGLVYYKSGTMLYQLKYILGDSLFLLSMKHYVEKWKFKHPYPEDFRTSIIEYTQIDLNWFFDQWLETTKNINYGIHQVKKTKTDSAYVYKIVLERKGRMQMPLKLSIEYTNNTTKQLYIPNTWYIPRDSSIVLPKWYGWDLLQSKYIFYDTTQSKIRQLSIDRKRELVDYDLTDNQWKSNQFSTWQWDHRVPVYQPWKYQRNYWRPDVWYNGFDGMQLGGHINGSYFNKYRYNVTLWGNTRIGQHPYKDSTFTPSLFSYQAYYQKSLHRFSRDFTGSASLSYYGGIHKGILHLEKTIKKQDKANPRFTKLYLTTQFLYNESKSYSYQNYPYQWGTGSAAVERLNSTILIGCSRTQPHRNHKGKGDYSISIRTPFIGSDYNFSQVRIEIKEYYKFLKKLDWRNRLYTQIGLGTAPLESALYLAGGSPEQMLNNRFTRAAGWIPYDWVGYSLSSTPFHSSGGLNIRGYAGQLLPETTTTMDGRDTIVYRYVGKSGLSYSTEIEIDALTPIRAKGFHKNMHIDYYLFYDIGLINTQPSTKTQWSSIYMNAGFGFTGTLKFSPYDIQPMVLRLDFPIYKNQTFINENNIDFRYVLSIQKSF